VKIEAQGDRHPLRISMGIAAWREGLSAEDLLAQTRVAARRDDPNEHQPTAPADGPSGDATEQRALRPS
jgi:hypothetical protein